VEQRYHPRKQIALEIELYKSGHLIGNALTKNISFGGMLLSNGESHLSLHDNVLLRMWIEGEPYSLGGFVIHTAENQEGIMLVGMSHTTRRAYFNFLRKMAD
jgi:hypothetical protein